MADAKKDDGKEEEDGAAQVSEKKKGSSMKLIIIVVALLVLAGGGGAAYLFLLKPHSSEAGKKQAEAVPAKPQVVLFWPMDPFIVNLNDNDGERFMKVVLQLEVSDQLALEELNIIKPKLRDSILDLLSAKTYKEVMDPIGKQRLRDEIALRVNGYIVKGKILKVYFTEFVIQ